MGVSLISNAQSLIFNHQEKKEEEKGGKKYGEHLSDIDGYFYENVETLSYFHIAS